MKCSALDSFPRRSYCTSDCSSADLDTITRAVLETLEPLVGDRKCFRMINGVLVEMTVKEALPPLKTNTEGLKKVAKDLEEQLRSKQKELEDWKVRPYPADTTFWEDGLLHFLTPRFATEKAQCAGRSVVSCCSRAPSLQSQQIIPASFEGPEEKKEPSVSGAATRVKSHTRRMT